MKKVIDNTWKEKTWQDLDRGEPLDAVVTVLKMLRNDIEQKYYAETNLKNPDYAGYLFACREIIDLIDEYIGEEDETTMEE